jgi:hypothetical protein
LNIRKQKRALINYLSVCHGIDIKKLKLEKRGNNVFEYQNDNIKIRLSCSNQEFYRPVSAGLYDILIINNHMCGKGERYKFEEQNAAEYFINLGMFSGLE